MIISPYKALEKLSPCGYELVGYNHATNYILYARKSAVNHLFERLEINGQGARGEAVTGHAGISVVRGENATKGLVRKELLVELANVPDRGWTIIDRRDAAKDWLSRFCNVGLHRAEALAVREGSALLTETAAARHAVSQYADLVGLNKDMELQKKELAAAASLEQTTRAKRWCNWPGVMQIRGQHGIYELATLAISVFASVVEPSDSPFKPDDPLKNRELMWRIQILVDLLLREKTQLTGTI